MTRGDYRVSECKQALGVNQCISMETISLDTSVNKDRNCNILCTDKACKYGI